MPIAPIVLAILLRQPPLVTPYGSAQQAIHSDHALQTVLVKASRAVGSADGVGNWWLTGSCVLRGARQSLEIRCGNDGRFLRAAKGPLTDELGFDGTRAWTMNWSGIAHPADFGDFCYDEMATWLVCGDWGALGSRFKLSLTKVQPDGVGVDIDAFNGTSHATVILDQNTWRPKSLSFHNSSGDDHWSFGAYKEFGNRVFPTQITDQLGSQTQSYSITGGGPQTLVYPWYLQPKPDDQATTFDRKVTPTVDLKCIGGYMFVRPKINGKELGWFFLDSGADVMCLDPKTASKIGARLVGHEITSGAVAAIDLKICQSDRFQLGPVSFAKPTFYELDMSPFAAAFGIDLVGICGYDFLSRAVITVAPVASKLKVQPVGTVVDDTGIHWENIRFTSQIPTIAATFEGGHSGVFTLDTGSGNTVDFTAPTVAKLKLLANRSVQETQTGGAGGNVDSKQGNIAYFDLAGHKFDHPSVGFQSGTGGVFSTSYVAGNIGMGFMSHFRLVFDYPDLRLGFTYTK